MDLLQKNLPKYAIPKFIRFLTEFSTTSTLKIPKSQLKNESFNTTQITDPIYVLLPEEKEYVRLTDSIYNEIQNKKYRF